MRWMKAAFVGAILVLFAVPVSAQSDIGGAAQFTCGSSEAAVQASGAARVSSPGVGTIYTGYAQVSGINQNPVVARFDAAGNQVWCYDLYETGSDDGRAYGLWWDGGGTLYVVFRANGNGSGGTNLSQFTGGGWAPTLGRGGGPTIAVIGQVNPANGVPIRGTYLTARLSNGNINTINVTGINVGGGQVQISANSFFSPLNGDGSTMTCSGGSPFPYAITFSADLSSASNATATGCVSNGSTGGPGSGTQFGGGGGDRPGDGGAPGDGGETPGEDTDDDGDSGDGERPAFEDGRLNDYAGSTAVAYCAQGGGIAVYSAFTGELVLYASTSDIVSAATSAPALITQRDGVRLEAISADTLQLAMPDSADPFKPPITAQFPINICGDVIVTANVVPQTVPLATETMPMYTVQAGDTLFRIGIRFDVNYRDIAQANGIAPDDPIEVGQVLLIP